MRIDTDITLDGLIAEYEAIPGISYKGKGSRAQAAAEFIKGRSVTYWGVLPNGVNLWRVNGYSVHLESNICHKAAQGGQRGKFCQDMAAPEHNGRRLCKHVIAAEMAQRLRAGITNALYELMIDAGNAGEASITLFPHVWFTYDEAPQENLLDTYRVGRMPLQKMDTPISLTTGDLHQAMLRAGWQVKQRIGGGDMGASETWELEPSSLDVSDGECPLPPHETTRAHLLDGIAPNVAEDRAREINVRMHGGDDTHYGFPTGKDIFREMITDGI